MEYVAIFLVLLFVLFLIGRELVCWYFKINESLAVQIEIRDLLKGFNSELGFKHSSNDKDLAG